MRHGQDTIKLILLIFVILLSSKLTLAKDISNVSSVKIDYMTPYLNGTQSLINNPALSKAECLNKEEQDLSLAFFLQTIAMIDCNNVAISLGISDIKNNKLEPNRAKNIDQINLSSTRMCKDNISGKHQNILSFYGDCAYQLGKGIFVDGLWVMLH